MSICPCIFAAVVAAAAAPAVPARAEKPSLAVLPPSSPPYLVGIAEEIARIAVQAGQKRYRVVGPEAASKAIGDDGVAKLTACRGDDIDCRAPILAGLGTEFVLGGTLDQSDTAYEVRLWLLDVPRRELVGRLDRSILIASRRLEPDLAEAIPTLLAGKAEANGEIVVHASPPASLVTIDDVPAGSGAELKEAVAPGKHRVVIQAEGRLTTERWVEVAPNQVVRLDEKLVPSDGHLPNPAPEAPEAATHGPPVGRGGVLPPAGWVALALSAAAFGTGLYFGLQANAIDHQAGQVDANGVDQGLTRAQAVTGLNDARLGNYLFIGAGAALAVTVVFAVLQPDRDITAPSATGSGPLSLSWGFP